MEIWLSVTATTNAEFITNDHEARELPCGHSSCKTQILVDLETVD